MAKRREAVRASDDRQRTPRKPGKPGQPRAATGQRRKQHRLEVVARRQVGVHARAVPDIGRPRPRRQQLVRLFDFRPQRVDQFDTSPEQACTVLGQMPVPYVECL